MTQDEIQTAILQVCKVSGNDSDFNVLGFYVLCDRLVELGAAAEREWQGLTAKDLAEIPPSCFEGAIWADAKLKEKNT